MKPEPVGPVNEGADCNDLTRSDGSAVATRGGAKGKHRLLAQVNRLEQEIEFLQEELGKLEIEDGSSVALEELVKCVENVPDALLPMMNGPSDQRWDRWFEGPQGSRDCGCRIV